MSLYKWILKDAAVPIMTLEQAIQDDNLQQVIANVESSRPLDIANEPFINANGRRSRITPLIYAAEIGNLPIVEYLLEQGADVNYRGAFNRTALIVAAAEGNLQVVNYLLSRIRNPIERDRQIREALQVAIDEDVIDVLQNHLSNQYTAKSVKARVAEKERLRKELLKQFTPLWRFLAEQGVFVVSKSGKGKRVKISKGKKGDIEFERLGADPDVKAIVWSARSSDALDQFVDKLVKRKVKITGNVEDYFAKNVMRLTKKWPLYTKKDRNFG